MDLAARQDTRALALLGAAVPGGWLLYDLQKVLTSPAPSALAGLLPGALLVLLGGGACAWAISRARWLGPLALLLLGAASVLPTLLGMALAPTQIWMPRVAFLLLGSILLLSPRAVRRRLGVLRPGLCVGYLACHVAGTLFTPALVLPRSLAGLALLALSLGFVKHAWLRRAGTLLILAWPIASAAQILYQRGNAGRPDIAAPDRAADPDATNLLWIVMDTVRADRLAPYGHHRETTPRLDAFVREHATRYTRAWSTSSYTLPSHASMLTGLFSAEHGADHPRDAEAELVPRDRHRPAVRLRDDVPTLGEILREEGYRTGAIVANNAYLHHSFGLDRGFEHYDDSSGAWLVGHTTLPQFFGWLPRLGRRPFREGGAITEAALEWIRSGPTSRPSFLLLNYMDGHNPYVPPAAFADAFGGDRPVDPFLPGREVLPLLYDRCLLGLDFHLGELLEKLTASGWLEDTVVIVTADHGESLGDHDYWSHAWNLYEELVRVPLYLKPLHGRRQVTDDTPVTSVHLFDLALRELGLNSPSARRDEEVISEWYHGKSNPDIDRWGAETGRDVEIDLLAWVAGGVKFIVGSNGQVEAYDLENDPRELTPLMLTPREIEAAAARARDWWERYPPLETAAAELSPEVLGQLEDLGYLGGE